MYTVFRNVQIHVLHVTPCVHYLIYSVESSNDMRTLLAKSRDKSRVSYILTMSSCAVNLTSSAFCIRVSASFFSSIYKANQELVVCKLIHDNRKILYINSIFLWYNVSRKSIFDELCNWQNLYSIRSNAKKWRLLEVHCILVHIIICCVFVV